MGISKESAAAVGIPFPHHRSPVVCRNGCVATSQPLASSVGLDLLRRGANAADAAIGVAAALCVLEPCSTGLGGDMFALCYQNRHVYAINGSGCSPKQLSLNVIQSCHEQQQRPFGNSALAVTVPGAARGWEDLLQRHGSGKFSLADLLEPAASLAETGFPVGPITAYQWQNGLKQISQWYDTKDKNTTIISNDKMSNSEKGTKHIIPLTVDGHRAPNAGEIMTNPNLARVLRELGSQGATQGFYQNRTGQAIVDIVQKHGGVLTMDDLASHTTSLFPEPICTTYRDVTLWQVPPNGQGVAALIALQGLNQLEQHYMQQPNHHQQHQHDKILIRPETIGTADSYHIQIEMMKMGLADAGSHVACPNHMQVSNEWLLDSDRIGSRAIASFDPDMATFTGIPDASSCTVSFQVVDKDGNAISFVQSNYQGFGTGLVPDQCGFTLQNRGAGFALSPSDHPNVVAGGKRPYHTIIPGMLTWLDNNDLYATLSNMGGYMQPQGHLQLTVAMVAGGLDPQAAIDLPRFCIAVNDPSSEKRIHNESSNATATTTTDHDDENDHRENSHITHMARPSSSSSPSLSSSSHSYTHIPPGTVVLETGIDPADVEDLQHRRRHAVIGNVMGHARSLFGRAQIIKRDRLNGVLWAGSDGRADGCAMGY